MKTCPNCGYVRKDSDAIISEEECPKCGIIYRKWEQQPKIDEQKKNPPSSSVQTLEGQDKNHSRFERILVAAVILILVVVVAVPLVIRHFRSTNRDVQPASFTSVEENRKPVIDTQHSMTNPSAASIERTAPLRELSISDIIQENRESVVVVKTASSVGSGFFISRNGYVVTNRHVLPRGEAAEIKTVNGRVFQINGIVHEDALADLIIVSTDASLQESKPVRLSGRLPQAGEKIIVIGNPLGLEQTVSDGIVSAVRRNQSSVEFIQVTAPVSPGNSGGPLFNMRGEVIGVATFQYRSGQNLNFCVAASRIISMQEQSSFASSDATGNFRTNGGQEVYCYEDTGGRVLFVDWKTGLLVTRPDGSLDRAKYENWVMEQIGGHPDNINPDSEAREDLERNREKLFKSVFPHRSINDTNLTSAEKDWLERRYQRHYVEVYNKAAVRRNEAIRKYRSMMNDFEQFAANRKQ